MSRFDPYHKWLSISPKDQPPTLYRLLGIDLFESDRDVIDAAANRQMSYLKQLSVGEHVADAQQLLGEIAAARICLLSPEKKAEYDRELREGLSPASRGAWTARHPFLFWGGLAAVVCVLAIVGVWFSPGLSTDAPDSAEDRSTGVAESLQDPDAQAASAVVPTADAVAGRDPVGASAEAAADLDALRPGLVGQYFSDLEFRERVLARIDPQVFFDWGPHSPTPMMRNDGFSVRWQGYLRAPQAGKYTLVLVYDNGVRLTVDGKVLIDHLDRRATGRMTAEIELDAEPHRLQLDYLEGKLTATCRFKWLRNDDATFAEQPIAPECLFHTMRQIIALDESGSSPVDSFSETPANLGPVDPERLRPGLVAEYFTTLNFGLRAFTRVEPTVSYDWRIDAPDSRVPADLISIRWTGYLVPPKPGLYTLSITSDDGSRLLIDGRLLFDGIDVEGSYRNRTTVVLTDKPHFLQLDYREDTFIANCKLAWQPEGEHIDRPIPAQYLFHLPEQEAGTVNGGSPVTPVPAIRRAPRLMLPGLWGEYFADARFMKRVMARMDPVVNFDWQDRSPHPEMPIDDFSVRWHGYLRVPAPGKYTIVVLGDDGVRVRLDDTYIINELDKWGRVRRTAVVESDGKPHELNIDYREQDNHAWCQLRWSREGLGGFEEKPIDIGFLFHTPEQEQLNTAGK